MALNPINGTDDPDIIDGTEVGDGIRAGAGDDVVQGLGGNDALFGEADDDALSGGEGDDRAYGGGGQDSLDGGDGADLLGGGDGDDLLTGGEGGDEIFGGAGNDVINTSIGGPIFRGSAVEFVDAGQGDDQVRALGLVGSELHGGAGTDSLFLIAHDTVGDLVIDLSGAGPSDILITSFEHVALATGGGNDQVTGTGFGDDIDGNLGNNTVHALGGDDTVGSIYGYVHELDGGTGNDMLRLTSLFGWIADAIVFSVTGNAATDGYGSSYADFETYAISGENLDDDISLGTGNDKGFGRGGGDALNGGEGDDTLSGGSGDDALNGGEGADRLMGGGGLDELTGGAGADRFRIGHRGPGQPADVITDMETGVDRLLVARAHTGAAPDVQLPRGRLDGANFATGVALGEHGQFVYVTDTADGHLLWDGDGSGAGAGVELALLAGAPAIGAGDIILF